MFVQHIPSRGRFRVMVAGTVACAALSAVLPNGGATAGAQGGGAQGDGAADTRGTRATTTTTGPTTTQSGALAEAEGQAAVLRRDRSEIRAEIADLRARRAAQFDRWALTQLAWEEAQLDANLAVMAAEKARRDRVSAEQRVREYAAEAFMNPPASNGLAVLAISDAVQLSRAHDILAIVADDQSAVVRELQVAQATAERRAAESAESRARAEAAAAAVKAELDQVDELLASQRRLDAEIDARLDSALAEVAALREVDRRAAAELEEEEAALADEARVAGASVSAPTTAATEPSGGSTAARPASGAAAAPTTPQPTTPKPTAPKPTTPKPTGPPPPPPSGLPTWQDMTKVGGIWINKSIASRLESLLTAARSAGIVLGGGGFRDPADQIRLRQAHCGPTDYDIYYKPASQCTPPTAAPGKSMHERGLAVDFTVGGRVISSRQSPAFQWLAANASSYGFYNLPSEPWHWSTNGN